MAMIKDDTTPWQGPAFEFGKPKGQWPSEANRPPLTNPVDDINTAISSVLKRADNELLSEDGTGEYILVGSQEEEEIK